MVSDKDGEDVHEIKIEIQFSILILWQDIQCVFIHRRGGQMNRNKAFFSLNDASEIFPSFSRAQKKEA